MPIETLDDITEQLADLLGVYGSHGDELDDENPTNAVTCTPKKPCRVCWTSDLRDRILAAVEVERKLNPAPVEPAQAEPKCKRCNDRKRVARVYGKDYDCELSTMIDCPDCANPSTADQTGK